MLFNHPNMKNHIALICRTVAVHFTDPFHVSTRVADKCNDGTLLLQVILHSQVKATLTIYDAWLELQDGFIHTGQGTGRPTSSFFPLMISPTSRAGIMFSIRLGKLVLSQTYTSFIHKVCYYVGTVHRAFNVIRRVGKAVQGSCHGALNDLMSRLNIGIIERQGAEQRGQFDEVEALQTESILNIRYGIYGERTNGAHPPVSMDGIEPEDARQDLLFKSAIVLQRPVLDPCLAVGFLPLPSTGLRVGQLITMQWRVERLKGLEDNGISEHNGEVLYEVSANSENWMLAGRKRGHVTLSTIQGSRIVISVLCVPLVAGYVRPPQLGLPNVDESNISCNPPGPHLLFWKWSDSLFNSIKLQTRSAACNVKSLLLYSGTSYSHIALSSKQSSFLRLSNRGQYTNNNFTSSSGINYPCVKTASLPWGFSNPVELKTLFPS
ncbi:hypothetical protein NC653_027969 [Populus alba x Populus x berolinensis]|uniref:TRAPPC10/Trs130 C-terminal domain-containing protein n=1 Tax=Populus alba x Populus x berolinensis TaxID=444605 RepID=A0AAD6M6Q1_9ROSI|nr:hypothetical protein NC653_027969 [Populus alba x Populus x berolinensis]